MERRLSLSIMVYMLTVLLIGCIIKDSEPEVDHIVPSTQVAPECIYNTAFEKYSESQEVGLIVNEPSIEMLEDFTHLEAYRHSVQEERILIIPKYNGSKVMVQRVEFDGKDFVVKKILYSKEQTDNNYGLLLETIRPEGVPELMITIITPDNNKIDYLVAYNGKDGIPALEYLTLEEDSGDKEEEIEVQIISAMAEGDYLQGYNLLDQQEVDIDHDQIMESLEVYCTADFDDKGNLLIDDGQEWTLILRKGNKIYPVLERCFIQIGQLEYKVYTEYVQENIFHILISRVQGAGLVMYDCYYDREQDAFISRVVYQTEGNVGIGIQYH